MSQTRHDSSNVRGARFRRDGFLAPVHIMDPAEAATHRDRLDKAEALFGDLHYEAKVYTILRSPLELATHPRVLETVTALIGPNVLLWNATYIVKEPGATAHVSWHQDLAHWGLEDDDQVSMWLALSPANDTFHHFGADIPASADLQPDALARQWELDRQVRATMGEQQARKETSSPDRSPSL